MESSPLVTSVDSFTTFGALLKYLRRRQRLTQLELSIAVGYSEAQISRLEKGQRLPDLAALKALFIPALALGDEPLLATRFIELAQAARQADAPAPGMAPYKGLLFFDEMDAELFFGREALTARLVDHIVDLSRDATVRFLTVVGASGSGKSSLVRAGLAFTLKRAGWDTRIFTPTANPLSKLELQLNHAQIPDAERILIIVDQFEELFTLCHNEVERVAFIDKLLRLAQDWPNKVSVVIALRADFYAHCAHFPPLRQVVAAEQEYIGQMTFEELRRAIEEPARRGGWLFEPGLVDRLLGDIGEHRGSHPEPGALPLLSHALLATWELRRGRTFTLEGYEASGGVRGAIAETAENLFNDQLNQAQQEIARDVFLRLTELGEGTEDTRRRATLYELVRDHAEAAELRGVLNTLAEARLITLNEDSAEVAHEALIREWHRLHGWLTEDRDSLLLHRHLTETAQDWQTRGHDPAELYRGGRLAQAREWTQTHTQRLNELEHAFLTASVEQEERAALEREAQRQRELEAAQKLAETEQQRAEDQTKVARQLRQRAFFLVVVAALAVIAAFSAGIFAYGAQANFILSEAQRLVAEANNLLRNNGDTNLIGLLAVRSLTTLYTPYGDSILTGLTTLEAPPREFSGHTADVWGVDFSPDGNYLATGSTDGTARLWDLATGETLRIFSGHEDEVGEVQFSPDGRYLLTASFDHTARLWDVTSGEIIQVFSGPSALDSVAFSPDGKTIVTSGYADNTVRLWDIATGLTMQRFSEPSGFVPRVAFSPDGKYLLTGSITARLWDVATGHEVRNFSDTNIDSVTFSPDSKYIATGNDAGVATIWHIATGELVREFTGHTGFVSGVRFSPDGLFLLTGSGDRTARLWDIASGQTVRVFSGHADGVQTVTFSLDGRLIATASNDGIARVWSVQSSPASIEFAGQAGGLRQASFSPDGTQIVTANENSNAHIWDIASGQRMTIHTAHFPSLRSAIFSGDGKTLLVAGTDHTASLWDVSKGQELRRFEGHTDVVNRAVFSLGGKYVVTASFDGTARVWDAETGETILIFDRHGPGHVNRAAVSPDGRTVATSGDDRTARIWNLLTGEELMVFEGHTDAVYGVAFSPDGRRLATASSDGTVRLWEIANGKVVRRFAGHPEGAFGVAFSADGNYLATSGADGTARLWDVQSGEEVRRFAGHTHFVRDVAFSPDGKYILTASADGTARLWLTDYLDAVKAVCALLTRDLTPHEREQYGIRNSEPTCPD